MTNYLLCMEKQAIWPIVEKVRAEVADFTIGFAILRTCGDTQDADVAGSGSLVTIGSIDGILTAAHVLRNLPDHGEVGIVRFPRARSFAQKPTINMGQAEKLTLAADVFGPEWPDIGFLRLSPEDVGGLKARNVFFNLGMRRDSVLADDQPNPPYFDGISGMIAERTTELPPELGRARVKGFHALYGLGCVVGEHESNGFDLFDFEVNYGPRTDSPYSYKGMSGGALWRVYCTKDDNGELSVVDKKVFGVAFYQSDLLDQKRIIICHGPRSVYGPLIEAIREKWPE